MPSPAFFLLPISVALATTLVTILIHGAMVLLLVHFLALQRSRRIAGLDFWRDLRIVATVAVVALAAHLAEIVTWAVVLVTCGQVPLRALYRSAMIYTTLNYDTSWIASPWKLLGPLEAADGMLMFGISTALVFAVIERLLRLRFPEVYH